MPTRKKLEDHTAEELKTMDYTDILTVRKEAYERIAKKMKVPDGIKKWAAEMSSKYGPKVRVWKNEVTWVPALLIVRYGEDPMQWPPELNDADVQRAEMWEKKPASEVQLLPKDEQE